MALIYNEDTGRWEDISPASDIFIEDLSQSYESETVEEAFQEVASWNIKNKTSLIQIQNILNNHENDIEYLKEHGGGGSGGGGSLPTITTNSESEIVVESGTKVELPILFASPNLGDGLAYILFDNVEQDSITIKQGSNIINVGLMPNLRTKVSIYVKDRAGLISNQLDWTIISGGIDLELDFDYNVDYSITDEIYMPYYISSATTDPINLEITIDGETFIQSCSQGYNSYLFEELSVGIHQISLIATDGTYNSKKYEFNLVILNADSLYLSTTFKNDTQYEYGSPILINYRISDPTKRSFTVNLYLDDKLNKTLSSTRGSYFWTLTDTAIGSHTFKVEVSSEDGDYRMIEGSFSIIEGEYTPISINTQGLIYRLNPSIRTNQDSDRESFDYEGITTNLYGFNFSSNGWIDGELVCNGGSYGIIDYQPFLDNAKSGLTIEVYYKSTDIGKDNALVIDCSHTDPDNKKRLKIGLEECYIGSVSQPATSFVNPDEYIKVSFVIDRRNKFAKIYINGVCSRAFALTDTGSGVDTIYEDFVHDSKIYINCDRLMENIGCCNIKDILIYKRALSDDEILRNTIAYISDLAVQKVNYNFEFNNTTLSSIRMYGDTTNMNELFDVQMRIKYTSANTDKYGQSFDLPYCLVRWQGTSSKFYVIKNYQVRLRDSNMQPYYYSPFPNGIPEWIFCFKADYMESTHSRNVGIARLLNDCLYSTKNPAQIKNSNIRNTIDGFSCILYLNDELVGIYNFNTDRYSTESFGYTDEENTLVYEISANTDTTAGAFFKTDKTGEDRLNYYRNDFTCLYPPTRAAGNDSYNEIAALVEWVDNASDEDFKDNIGQHFNKEYLIRYFIYVYIFGAVDSLGKNMKLASWDGGNIWYIQPYDCDTTIGLDNSGFMKFKCDIEVGQDDTFNTTKSRLWEKVMRVFAEDIRTEYALLRRTTLTNENIFKYIIDDQIMKIPKYYYNHDAQKKYLDFGTSYLYALHGNGELYIKQWMNDRLLYTDTLFGYNVPVSDYVMIRVSARTDIDVYLDIQTFKSMYLTVKWENSSDGSGTDIIKVNKGETKRFTHRMQTEQDQEVFIYAAPYLKSIGDLSILEPTTVSIAKAPKITELVCHSSNLVNTDVSSCINLNKLDLSDSPKLGVGIVEGVSAQPILNVSQCKNIEYVNCKNTAITEVKIDEKGSNIKQLLLSKSIQVITLNNCPNLTSIDLETGHNCKKISLNECHNTIFGSDTISYLSGIVELELTNSCDRLKEICIENPSKLEKINLYNCLSLEKIRLGIGNILNSLPSFTIENAKTGKDVTIIAKKCDKLKEFMITGYGRTSASEFTRPVRDQSSSYSNNQYNTYICNILDISETNIENINILATSLINEIKVPNTFKNLRCNSKYDTYISEWAGLEGTYGSCIYNIYNPIDGYTHDSENKIWNMQNLNLQDFDISNLNEDSQIIMQNLNVIPINNAISFNMHNKSVSPKGTVDYTNYKGTSLYYAFSNSNSDDLNIILPETFETVTDFTKAFYYCKQNWNWEDVVNIINSAPKVNTIGDETFAYSNLINNGGVIFNTDNIIELGSNLFKNSNLEIIDEFNMPNSNYTYDSYELYGLFAYSKLQSIGNININKGKYKCMFYQSSNLISIGQININDLIDTSAEYMCQSCYSLENIGVIDNNLITNYSGSFRGTKIKSIELNVENANNISYILYSCSELENVILKNLDINTTLTNTESAFYKCIKLQSITGGDTLPSSITNTNYMYRGCTNLTTAPLLPKTLNSSLTAMHMCRDTKLGSIGNLPEKLVQADFMFASVPVNDSTIILPSTLVSAENMLDSAAATDINITINAQTTNVNGLLSYSTSQNINFNMTDPITKRKMQYIIGYENPNLVSVTGLNLYNATWSEYLNLNCPSLTTIDFTNNSEIVDSLNLASSPLLEVSSLQQIIDILWDATGWEEYETITNEDGSTEEVLKVKLLTLGKANLSKLSQEYIAKAQSKNWSIA